MPCKVTTTSEVGARDLDRPFTIPIPPLPPDIITTDNITMATNTPHMGAPETPVDMKIAHVIGPLPKNLIRTRCFAGTKNFQVGLYIQGMLSIAMKAKNSTPMGPTLYPPRGIRQHTIPEVNLTWWLLQLALPTPAYRAVHHV
jgi:hypothetical protein